MKCIGNTVGLRIREVGRKEVAVYAGRWLLRSQWYFINLFRMECRVSQEIVIGQFMHLSESLQVIGSLRLSMQRLEVAPTEPGTIYRNFL